MEVLPVDVPGVDIDSSVVLSVGGSDSFWQATNANKEAITNSFFIVDSLILNRFITYN
ncbi:hypothetical protein GCM10027036_11280 [Flavihumibacter cheonanensis]